MEPAEADSDIELHSVAKGDDETLLRKYFCKVKNTQMDVVVEMSVDKKVTKSKVPQHLIIVIDVSDSMNAKMHENSGTLLERVQFFAQLLVKNIDSEDWLSIIAFSSEAKVHLNKMKMDEHRKTLAYIAIREMTTDGMTNLSKGIMTAVDVLNEGYLPYVTRDAILVFTDGQANLGITNADKFVDLYKQKTAHRKCKIHLAAMTMGDYKPEFLSKISSQLGSDAFYWLKEDSDFEADMFTPVFLRDTTAITDISLQISCTNDQVTIVEDKFSTEHLESEGMKRAIPINNENEAEGNENNNKLATNTLRNMWTNWSKWVGLSKIKEDCGDIVGLRYFIYGLPSSLTKNVSFSLNVPEDKTKLNEQIIVNVVTTFYNENMELCTCEDNLQLINKHTMKRMQIEDKTAKIGTANNPTAQAILSHCSAYTMQANVPATAWIDAKEAFCKILQQESKKNVIEALSTSSENLTTKDFDLNVIFEKAIDVCKNLENTITLLFGEEDEFTKLTKHEMNKDIDVLKSSNLLVCDDKISENLKWVMLRSREISFAKEMPSTSTVFDLADNESQPYMPRSIRKQLVSIQQDVHKEAKQRERRPYRAWIID